MGKGGVSLDNTCASAMRRSQPLSFTEDKSESTSDGVASLDAMLQVYKVGVIFFAPTINF